MLDPDILKTFWTAVGIHLWQSTVVIAALLLPYMLLRSGPARLNNMLWTIALAKLFLPLPLLARLWEPLAAHIVPLLPSFLRGAFGAGLAGKVTYVLDPAGFAAAAGPATGSGSGAPYIALTAAWLAGAGWLTLRWVRWRRVLRTLICRRSVCRVNRSGFEDGTPVYAAEPVVKARLLEALENTGIPVEVVRIMPGSALPAVTGLFRRRIVVSEGMVRGLAAVELKAVLLHEQEHRRRFDPLRTLIKRIALAAFFYYPPLWALLRRLNLSCEMACDQAAIRAGVKPSAFAHALARTLELGLGPAPAAAGLGIREKSAIKSRFEHINQPRSLVTMRRHRFALLGAVALVVMITLFPLPSCVKDSDAPSSQETPEVTKAPASPGVPEEGDSVKPPALIEEAMVLPEYPEAERDAGIEGSVILQAVILKDGSVGEITVVEGVEGHPAMEESAKQALGQCRFKPATEDGNPVDMTIQIPIAFRLDDDKKAGSGEKATETMPQLITESIVKPEYPEEARDAGATGMMLVEVEVLPDGTAGKITVKEGIPGYPVFDQMAIEAVRQWRFTPGTRNGKPVSARVMIPLEFSLDNEK